MAESPRCWTRLHAAVALAVLLLHLGADDVSGQVIEPQRDHSPSGALWRAAAVPGWGQIYNRQYYKLPFVYGGLAGIAYAAHSTHSSYASYRRAYWYAEPRLWENGVPQYPEFEQDYREFLIRENLPLDEELGEAEAAQRRQRLAPNLRRVRDNLRRNRDLLYIGVGLFYGITIIDAYVSAHLLDFDIGEDLSMQIAPSPFGLHARIVIDF